MLIQRCLRLFPDAYAMGALENHAGQREQGQGVGDDHQRAQPVPPLLRGRAGRQLYADLLM